MLGQADEPEGAYNQGRGWDTGRVGVLAVIGPSFE